MAESSRFRKTVDLIKQRANSILDVVFKTAGMIAVIIVGVLGAIICPSAYQLVDDDDDMSDDMADFLFGVWAMLYMFVDALFLFVPLINEETKCVMLDKRLKIAAIVLRSVGDLRYLFKICLHIKHGLKHYHQERFPYLKIAMSVAIDMVCILPVPQVVILIFLPKMKGSRSLKIMKFLNSLILLQYLPRLFPFFKMCNQVNRDMLDLFKKKNKEKPDRELPKWFGIAVNILGYILASHVLGAFWYFFSIQREIDCWGYACRIENGCEFSTSCVEKTFKNITHIKNFCLVNPPNATVFDFGIFLYALQSGIQGSTNFPEKFLQCFSWGLRNLSSFASNLNSITYGWENLFVVVISISGLVLFMYLLGHSQTYMQETDKRDRIKQKMKMSIEPKIKALLSEYGLSRKVESSGEMKSTIFGEFKILPEDRYFILKMEWVVELILEKDEDFILENMFSILSCNLPVLLKGHYFLEGFDLEIKTMLFLDKLKKVDWLRDKDEDMLKKICEHLERLIYTEGSYIIREGEPLDMMFFVTQGTVLTYTTNDERNIKVIEKEKDSWYGEELLTLAEWTSSKLFTLPISTFSVKSQKKVEILALKATDLPNVVSKFPGHFNTDHMEIEVHNNSSNISARHDSRQILEGCARRGDVSKRDQGYESC